MTVSAYFAFRFRCWHDMVTCIAVGNSTFFVAGAIMRACLVALPFVLAAGLTLAQNAAAPIEPPAGWQTMAQRDEIKPRFAFDPKGGPKGDGALTISADQRDGLHGWWQKSYPVQGAKFYQFHAVRKTTSVDTPRRSVLARV